ncbi:hypothetical protein CSOJ01_06611 [Colletotrichum sojae]|uniref:Uncharacterized protein n=1 Tax=Colletotrichum sojae TaxID=2175907 RepID=A0A8H6JBG8_9PEZI|nr:hypothetical protein CSOJ01_06611 [Colletotrichum sojae]
MRNRIPTCLPPLACTTNAPQSTLRAIASDTDEKPQSEKQTCHVATVPHSRPPASQIDLVVRPAPSHSQLPLHSAVHHVSHAHHVPSALRIPTPRFRSRSPAVKDRARPAPVQFSQFSPFRALGDPPPIVSPFFDVSWTLDVPAKPLLVCMKATLEATAQPPSQTDRILGVLRPRSPITTSAHKISQITTFECPATRKTSSQAREEDKLGAWERAKQSRKSDEPCWSLRHTQEGQELGRSGLTPVILVVVHHSHRIRLSSAYARDVCPPSTSWLPEPAPRRPGATTASSITIISTFLDHTAGCQRSADALALSGVSLRVSAVAKFVVFTEKSPVNVQGTQQDGKIFILARTAFYTNSPPNALRNPDCHPYTRGNNCCLPLPLPLRKLEANET